MPALVVFARAKPEANSFLPLQIAASRFIVTRNDPAIIVVIPEVVIGNLAVVLCSLEIAVCSFFRNSKLPFRNCCSRCDFLEISYEVPPVGGIRRTLYGR